MASTAGALAAVAAVVSGGLIMAPAANAATYDTGDVLESVVSWSNASTAFPCLTYIWEGRQSTSCLASRTLVGKARAVPGQTFGIEPLLGQGQAVSCVVDDLTTGQQLVNYSAYDEPGVGSAIASLLINHDGTEHIGRCLVHLN